MFQVGDIIRHMTGGDWNAGYIYGIVEKSGPKTFTVRWQSGLRNRREHGDKEFSKVADLDLIRELKF